MTKGHPFVCFREESKKEHALPLSRVAYAGSRSKKRPGATKKRERKKDFPIYPANAKVSELEGKREKNEPLPEPILRNII